MKMEFSRQEQVIDFNSASLRSSYLESQIKTVRSSAWVGDQLFTVSWIRSAVSPRSCYRSFSAEPLLAEFLTIGVRRFQDSI